MVHVLSDMNMCHVLYCEFSALVKTLEDASLKFVRENMSCGIQIGSFGNKQSFILW